MYSEAILFVYMRCGCVTCVNTFFRLLLPCKTSTTRINCDIYSDELNSIIKLFQFRLAR